MRAPFGDPAPGPACTGHMKKSIDHAVGRSIGSAMQRELKLVIYLKPNYSGKKSSGTLFTHFTLISSSCFQKFPRLRLEFRMV